MELEVVATNHVVKFKGYILFETIGITCICIPYVYHNVILRNQRNLIEQGQASLVFSVFTWETVVLQQLHWPILAV